MNNIYALENKQITKRAEELTNFLLELDLICDQLYNRTEYNGVLDTLMKLEDVRITYYIELYELELKGKINNVK